MSGMPVSEESFTLYSGGISQQVAMTTASAQSSVITNSKTLYVVATAACFVRQGTNPTAVSDGTDQYIPANVPMRLAGFATGNRLACIVPTGTGTLYITPEK